MEERLLFSELKCIDAYMCILGLVFPESATEFQKAFLTLAHLLASSRDYVLKSQDVPHDVLNLIDQLCMIIEYERYKQR